MAATLARRIISFEFALPVALVAMDACWLYAAGWLIHRGVTSNMTSFVVPPPVLLAGLIALSWWVAQRLLDRTTLPTWAVQGISGLAGVTASGLAAALVNPPGPGVYGLNWLGAAFFAVIVGLVAWFIGGTRAAERPDFNDAYTSFRIGLVAIGLGALLTTIFSGGKTGEVWAELGSVPLWFFGWALAALALGNLEVVRREFGGGGSGSWGVVLAASILGILLIGSAAGAFGGGNFLEVVQNMVLGVIMFVIAVLYLPVYAIVWVISQFLVVGPSRRTIEDGNVEDAYSMKGRGLNQREFDPDFLDGPTLSNDARNMILLATALVLAIIVIWVVSRGVRRARQSREANALEDRESIGSWETLLLQLREWWNKLLARFRPGASAGATATEDDLAGLRGRPEWSGTLSIRQIYANLQKLAARAGYPRARQQTPVEYLEVLSKVHPSLRGDFTAITAAYLEARYGPLPASAPAVASANSAWKRAEPALRSAAGEG